jgi:hypothetical protein
MPALAASDVTLGTVVQKEVAISRECVGTMIGNVDAKIRPEVEGFLLKRLYAEGFYVTQIHA